MVFDLFFYCMTVKTIYRNASNAIWSTYNTLEMALPGYCVTIGNYILIKCYQVSDEKKQFFFSVYILNLVCILNSFCSLHFVPKVWILYSVCSPYFVPSPHFVLGLHFVTSLHFELGLQSAFCIDRMARPYDRFLLRGRPWTQIYPEWTKLHRR